MVQDSILFVGKRPEALEAAERLGYSVLLLSEKGPRSTDPVDRAIVSSFSPGVDVVTPARDLAEGCRVIAVAAGTERGVEPAAQVREALGVPGISLAAARRFTDKAVMRAAAHQAGIPCAQFISGDDKPTREQMIARLGLPLVLKDRLGSGGRNLVIAQSPDEVPLTLPPHRLAESFVRGTELSVESIVVDGALAFTNCTQYLDPRWSNLVPYPMDEGLRAQVVEFSAGVLRALGLERGMAHLELFLTEDGPWFGEVAARPPGGRIMELIRLAYDRDPWTDWIQAEAGIAIPPEEPSVRYAGMQVFHPGEGVVADIRGLAAARKVPGVVRVGSVLRRGKPVGPRLGVAQEGGHIVAAEGRPEHVIEALRAARECIQVTLEGQESAGSGHTIDK